MTTIYDQYQKMLQEQRKQTGLMFAQTALAATMAGSLNNIQAEMDAVRRQNLEGLAIQQEMLRREQLQGQLEEFVYTTEKTVAAYSDSKCDDPVTTRYFVLKGIIDTVEQNGICTAIIRGRENKADFQRVLGDVNRLATALETEPEVKEALAWINAEEERKAKRQIEDQQLAEANHRRETQRQQIVAKIRQQEASKVITFEKWYKRKIRSKLPDGKIGDGLQFPLWLFYGFMWIPALWGVWFVLWKADEERPLKEAADEQIAKLQEELRRLEG
jgi:hypothetical protein